MYSLFHLMGNSLSLNIREKSAIRITPGTEGKVLLHQFSAKNNREPHLHGINLTLPEGFKLTLPDTKNVSKCSPLMNLHQ